MKSNSEVAKITCMQITYRRETKEGRGGAWKNTKQTEGEDIAHEENVLMYNMPKELSYTK